MLDLRLGRQAALAPSGQTNQLLAMRRVFVCLLAALCAGHAVALDSTRVALEGQGEIEGIRDGEILAFRNIPYAAPPLGALRFAPPAAAPSWDGVRDAARFGPACIQTWKGAAPYGESEDCLTLNIWTPSTQAGQALPVMVWLHGGAFKLGTGASPFTDGAVYARRGIVLVTLNYRLGWLGFLAHPAIGGGNLGIRDQIAALEWVQRNIARFGGDPKRVTLFGESAGGISVHVLMVSPLARGLFSAAIAQSGFPRGTFQPIRGEGSAESEGIAFARTLGIEGSGPEAAAALRALPPESFAVPGPLPLGPPTVMRDGIVLGDDVEALYAAGEAAPVPLLTGGTSWEASLLYALTTDPPRLAAKIGTVRPEAVQIYGFGTNPVQAASDFITDYFETEPDRHIARLHAKAGNPAFVYRFSYLPPSQRGLLPGAMHGLDVFYVFGSMPRTGFDLFGVPIAAVTPPDIALSDAMIEAWARFATAHDPGWQPVGEGDPVMMFGDEGAVPLGAFSPERLDAVEALHGTEGFVPW